VTRAHDRSLQATTVLLVASVVLIVPSLVGLAASLPLLVAFAVLGGALFAVRDPLASAVSVPTMSVGPVLRVTWVGPVVAGLIVLVALDATPDELQALGGLCGLVAMANYFLRPVYGVVISLGRSVGRTLG